MNDVPVVRGTTAATNADEQINILWRGEIIIGHLIDTYRKDMHLDTVNDLDEFLMVVKLIRLQKVARSGARRRRKTRAGYAF